MEIRLSLIVSVVKLGIKTPKESRSLGGLSLPVMDNYYLLAYRHYSICENSLQDTPENKMSYFSYHKEKRTNL